MTQRYAGAAIADQARAVAKSITAEAFHNVTFFDGTYDEFRSANRP